MYLDNISSLRTAPIASAPTPIIPEEFVVAGYYGSGDGGGGVFSWVNVSFPATPPLDDLGIIIRHQTINDGYFKRIFSGPINVRWFGAKGDGLTDDTDAVHRARDSHEFALHTRENGILKTPFTIQDEGSARSADPSSF